jgi:hypothetical protein
MDNCRSRQNFLKSPDADRQELFLKYRMSFILMMQQISQVLSKELSAGVQKEKSVRVQKEKLYSE